MHIRRRSKALLRAQAYRHEYNKSLTNGHSLHGAGTLNGAQNYPQCFNIAVTGSGSSSLPTGTLGVNLYKNTDPGIYFNPYVTITSYAMPGPTLWTG